MDLSSDAVPAFHLPLSVDEAHSRQQTENLRSFPRAYTCPTYSTACQQQQLQQQQQQRAAAAGDVASYLSYAFYVNDATRNPYRGPPEHLGLLSVLGSDAAAPNASSSSLTCSSCSSTAQAAPSRKPEARRRKKAGSARFCCGLLGA